MTSESRDAVLERNVGRLVRRWADPLPPERIDGACADFLRRLAAPAPRIASGGRIGFAAALLLGAITFWAIFAWRGDRTPAPETGLPGGVLQADEDPEIRALFARLSSTSFEEQGRAAQSLERLGVKVIPALERAAKHENSQVREWAAKIRERILKSEVALRFRLAELIQKLGVDDFAEQGRAAEEIRKIGKDAIPSLKEARALTQDRRLTEWIDKLLAAIEKADEAAAPPQPKSEVVMALSWLARHQNEDGSWGAVAFQDRCAVGKCGGTGEKDYDAGLTAISLLAFLGAGYSQLSIDEYTDPVASGRVLQYGKVVKKGLQWLLAHQDPEGCIGERGIKYLYNHATAALCLTEAYGMTASKPLKEPAQKAIDYLVASQNPGKGWRYSAKCGDNDTSVTGWAVMALRSAEAAELHFPKAAYTGALNWLNEATEQKGYYQVGYNARGTGKVFVPGKNERFSYHPTMSAIGVACRIFMGQKAEEPAMDAVNLLLSDLPRWAPNEVDFYYWHFGSVAVYQYDGSEGKRWRKWNEAMKNALVPSQQTIKDGCRAGSWDSDQDRWGAEGSRVYTTAIGTLTLEMYYHYANAWGLRKK